MSEAPDYIHRVAGVRSWRLAPNLLAQLGGLLWAPGMREPWPTGEEFVATCEADPDHEPPEEGCACGIYAFYNPALAQKGGYWPVPGYRLYNRLLSGVIGVAGGVLLHERGFTAGRATVEAIFTDGADDAELPIPRAEIAHAYGASLISSDEFAAFCQERGLIAFDPDET